MLCNIKELKIKTNKKKYTNLICCSSNIVVFVISGAKLHFIQFLHHFPIYMKPLSGKISFDYLKIKKVSSWSHTTQDYVTVIPNCCYLYLCKPSLKRDSQHFLTKTLKGINFHVIVHTIYFASSFVLFTKKWFNFCFYWLTFRWFT